MIPISNVELPQKSKPNRDCLITFLNMVRYSTLNARNLSPDSTLNTLTFNLHQSKPSGKQEQNIGGNCSITSIAYQHKRESVVRKVRARTLKLTGNTDLIQDEMEKDSLMSRTHRHSASAPVSGFESHSALLHNMKFKASYKQLICYRYNKRLYIKRIRA